MNSTTPGVKIEIKHIEGLNLKLKDDKIILTMEAFMPAGDVARILNLASQGAPMSATIENPQAEFDLVVTEVNFITGEKVHDKEPLPAAARAKN